MKLFLIVFASVVAAKNCNQTTTDNGIKGKLVHRSCATIAVQVLDPKYYHLGQPTWQQSETKAPLSNVFTVANHCAFPSIEVGSEFTFTVIPEDSTNKDCMVCMMWDNPPEKKQFIKVKEK